MTEVRDAVAADAGQVADIWNHYIEGTAVTFNSAPKSVEETAAEIAARPAFVVAAEAGSILGFATYGQFRGGVGYRYSVENTVLLAPGASGRGMGRALIEALCDRARAQGHHSMIAGISGENPAGVAFHGRCGFTAVATIPEVGYKFGRWMDLVLMQRML